MASTSASTAIFEGTELASSGLPEGKEKEILESVKDKVPASVFTTPYVTPGQRQSHRRCATTSARPTGC